MNLCRLDLEKCKLNRVNIISILEDIFAVNNIANGPQAETLAIKKEADMEKFIDDNSAYVVAAFDGDSLVGFAWFYEYCAFNEMRFHLTEIGVVEQYRGNGIAHEMILIGMSEAKNRGIRSVDLYTNAENSAALKLYESIGFVKSRIHFVMKIDE